MKRRLFLFLLFAISPILAISQVAPSTRGGETSLRVGGMLSLFNPDYIANGVGGGGIYVDFDVNRRWGIEAAGRWLRITGDINLTEDHYQIGPRVNFLRFGKFHPYAKGIVGVAEFNFPTNAGFVTGSGGYLTYGVGGGLDYRLNQKWTIRPVDFELQHWPNFTTGAITPYGVSVGASYRIF
jgi:Outer membrane protein beta-barrel domain